MEELVKNLAGIWYIATSEDGQPHVRPFDKAALVNDNIYIGTSKNKKVFEQIIKNPKIEIYAMTDFGPCRFMAEAYLEDDQDIVEDAYMKMGKIFNPEESVAIRLEKIMRY